MMAVKNLKSLYVNYLDSMPVYVKEIKDDFSKFDELLDDHYTVKVKYVDKEYKLNIIALIKLFTKFDRFFNLNDLYEVILNIKINEFETLKQYIYKEKHILNQF